jgi:hypothetical protein
MEPTEQLIASNPGFLLPAETSFSMRFASEGAMHIFWRQNAPDMRSLRFFTLDSG